MCIRDRDYRDSPEPPEQENMPDAATAPAEPATNMPPKVDPVSYTHLTLPTSDLV